MIRQVYQQLGRCDPGEQRRHCPPAAPGPDHRAGLGRGVAVNLKSVFLVTQAVLPAMRAAKWGRIVNLSSVAAQTGGVVGPHYAASKAGIHGLTHSYAALWPRKASPSTPSPRR